MSEASRDPLAQWLDEMEAKARAATPGPWVDAMDSGIVTPTGGTICHVMMHANLNTVAREGEAYSHADAAFIAALPPETVQALIECVRAASRASEEIQSQRTAWPGEVDTLADAIARLRRRAKGDA